MWRYKVYGIKVDSNLIPVKTPGWNDKFIARLCCKVACEDLLSYGTTYKTFEWKVPEVIKQSPVEIIAEFIKGFADSEGDVDMVSRRIGLTSASEEGLEGMKFLFTKLEIRSSLHPKSKRDQHIFYLRIQDRKSVERYAKLIGFTIKRKQKALSGCIKGYKLYVTPHKESEKLHDKVLELRKQGYSFNEISEKSGLSIGTVWRHLHKN